MRERSIQQSTRMSSLRRAPRFASGAWEDAKECYAAAPRADAERDSDKRTMGVGLTHSSSIEKKCSCRTYTPREVEETGLRAEDDGGGI
jgi:hypothetical protein